MALENEGQISEADSLQAIAAKEMDDLREKEETLDYLAVMQKHHITKADRHTRAAAAIGKAINLIKEQE